MDKMMEPFVRGLAVGFGIIFAVISVILLGAIHPLLAFALVFVLMCGFGFWLADQ